MATTKVGAERWRFDGQEFLDLSIRVRFENADEWLNPPSGADRG
jgi:hypothetical protein